jgi:hypothetical protein
MVAAPLHPTHETDFLADVRGGNLAAVMSSLPISQDVVQESLLHSTGKKTASRLLGKWLDAVEQAGGALQDAPPAEPQKL